MSFPYFVVKNPRMRTLVIGIDSGTQSTKALVVDANTGKVLAAAAEIYDLLPNLPPGSLSSSSSPLGRRALRKTPRPGLGKDIALLTQRRTAPIHSICS